MQEIAEICGMSKGSLYLIFKSKEELEDSTMEYCLFTLIDELSQIEHEADLTPRERSHKQIETLLGHVSELKEFLRVQMQSMMMNDEPHRKENATRSIKIWRSLHYTVSRTNWKICTDRRLNPIR